MRPSNCPVGWLVGGVDNDRLSRSVSINLVPPLLLLLASHGRQLVQGSAYPVHQGFLARCSMTALWTRSFLQDNPI